MGEDRVRRRLAAILSADVVGYSKLMEADESGTLAGLKLLRREVFEPLTSRFGGRIFKLTGDGAFTEFGSALDAVRSAVAIQTALAERNATIPQHKQVKLRIGISVGDVIVEGTDLYGNAVNIASRLEALAEPGGICVSGGVHEHVRNSKELSFADLGDQKVKNMEQPVRAYGVVLDCSAPDQPKAVVARSLPEKPSIAVLAFDNMSAANDQSFFSDGITEDIITDLSKISELHVIARNSSFAYKGRAVSVPEVAAELGVRYVLEGSVRTVESRVRVTAQLIDATNGGHVWAERFDRDMTDIFAVQDEVTREIVGALRLRLTAEDHNRLTRRRKVPIEAYNLFLRGREQSFLHTRAGNIEARSLLSRAIEIVPDYAAAHGRIAFTHVIDYVNEWTDDQARSLETGLEMARSAVEMDADDAHAQFAFSIASLWSGDLDTALAAGRRCLALEPGSAEGHLAVAHTQIFAGDARAALATIESYTQLDPLYPDIVLHFRAEAHISLGQYDEAIAALRQRLERDPNSSTSYNLLAACYGHLGQCEEARAAWAQARRLEPDFSVEQRRRVLPFRNPADFEHRIDGIRRAGLVI